MSKQEREQNKLEELAEKIINQKPQGDEDIKYHLPIGFTKEMLLSQTTDKKLRKQL